MATQLLVVAEEELVNQPIDCPCFRAIEWMLSTRNARLRMAKHYFGERLKLLIAERDWNNVKFAAHFKIDPSMVSHYTRGISKPEVGFLLDIVDTFDVSADWLLGRTEDRHSHKKNVPHN